MQSAATYVYDNTLRRQKLAPPQLCCCFCVRQDGATQLAHILANRPGIRGCDSTLDRSDIYVCPRGARPEPRALRARPQPRLDPQPPGRRVQRLPEQQQRHRLLLRGSLVLRQHPAEMEPARVARARGRPPVSAHVRVRAEPEEPAPSLRRLTGSARLPQAAATTCQRCRCCRQPTSGSRAPSSRPLGSRCSSGWRRRRVSKGRACASQPPRLLVRGAAVVPMHRATPPRPRGFAGTGRRAVATTAIRQTAATTRTTRAAAAVSRR